jgi:hypothetical protein
LERASSLCNWLSRFAPRAKGDEIMLALLALVLIICWLLGMFAFHVSTGLFHILLVIGVILLIMHFLRGRALEA